MSNNTATKYTTNAIKTAATTTTTTRQFKKAEEATDDLIGNKIADKVTVFHKSHHKILQKSCIQKQTRMQ